MSDNPDWSINLRGLRYREDLTLADFSKKLGLTKENVLDMENGKMQIGEEISKKIQTVFSIDYRLFCKPIHGLEK